MTVFLTTLGLIGMAEMGDKTQLLTLALAARLPLGAVLGGVALATLLNHALAVAVGGSALLVVRLARPVILALVRLVERLTDPLVRRLAPRAPAGRRP